MKEIVERILVGIIAFEIVVLAFHIAVDIFENKEKQYKYLTIENEWGISNKCYIDNDQFAVCEIDEVLTIVRQYYEI